MNNLLIRLQDNADAHLFAAEVRNSAGSSVSLGVFSGKGQRIRELYVQVPKDTSQGLGLSLQWMPLSTIEDVWHILDVQPNSPADLAGLLPYGDYVIGSPDGMIRGESGLGEIIEDYLNRELRLHVYNHEYNVARTVVITPSRSWGGTGALGCVLGFGALHRIPAPLDEPPQAPGETLFDTTPEGQKTESSEAYTSSGQHYEPPAQQGVGAEPQFIVPANVATPPPPMGGTPRGGRKQRHHVPAVGGGGLDDYFKEGEEKSMAADNAPKASGGKPPPPKVGGPPGGPPKATQPSVEEGEE